MSGRTLAMAFALLVAFATRDASAAALSGSLTIVGSDTLSTLVLRWSDAFRARHPGVSIQLQTPGSASAPIALLEGAADIGAMSRPMSEEETARFTSRFGYAPTGVAVAHDAIVVFVHPDNPLESITKQQLDAIYSGTRRCGATAAIERWGAIETSRAGAGDARILATGRNSASGTNEFFRERALCGGEYRADVVVWPGHGATVAAVAGNRAAIGYAGIGYVNGLVKPLAYVPADGVPPVAPVMANVMNGDYPLARPLYLYVNRAPDRAPAPLPAAFLAYVLSNEAQAKVAEDGFLPLAGNEREAQTRLIDGH
ncbi:MAG: phosphate ABC transporter substrate-binding protein [Rhodanobacteraceae bacterium]